MRSLEATQVNGEQMEKADDPEPQPTQHTTESHSCNCVAPWVSKTHPDIQKILFTFCQLHMTHESGNLFRLGET